MLPWRRRKFVLAEEPRHPAKSLRPALACPSLLRGLLPAPPPAWPPAWPRLRRALRRVFRRRRRRVQLSREEPALSGRYLGSAATLRARGDGCTDAAVGRLWARAGAGPSPGAGPGGARMRLTLCAHGLRLQPAAGPALSYALRRITHCGPDGRRPRVLAWVYRHPARLKAEALRCHAVLLARARDARALARRLRQAARAALSDFRRLQRQSDARHTRLQRLPPAALPRAPPRRRLNATCAYKQAGERARGAQRLGSIAEEDEEEEEEEEEDGEQHEGRDGAAGCHGYSDGGLARTEPRRDRRPDVLGLARELGTCSLRASPLRVGRDGQRR